jgi:hypothetical protein
LELAPARDPEVDGDISGTEEDDEAVADICIQNSVNE